MATEEVLVRISSDARAAEEAIRRIRRNLDDVSGTARGATDAVQSLSKQFTIITSIVSAATIAETMSRITKSIAEATMTMQKLEKTFLGALGSQAKAAAELSNIRNVSNELGLDLVATSESFSKFAAAVRNTSLEGEQAREIFESVAVASTGLGLSASETYGIFYSFEQMVSKGVVMSEELKRQLGDRLPGALRLASEAMGMTTAQFIENLEAGKILATDMLPKLAAVLKSKFSDAAKVGAAQLQAAINLLKNDFLDLRYAIGKELEPAFKELINLTRDIFQQLRGIDWSGFGNTAVSVLSSIRENLDTISNIIKTLGALATSILLGRIVGAFSAMSASAIAFVGSANFATAALARFNAAVGLMGGPVGIAVAAVSMLTFGFLELAKAEAEAAEAKLRVTENDPATRMASEVTRLRAELAGLKRDPVAAEAARSQGRAANVEAELNKYTSQIEKLKKEKKELALTPISHPGDVKGIQDRIAVIDEEISRLNTAKNNYGKLSQEYLKINKEIDTLMAKRKKEEEETWDKLKNNKAGPDKKDEYAKAIEAADEIVSALKREREALTQTNDERKLSEKLHALEKAGITSKMPVYKEYVDKIKQEIELTKEVVREQEIYNQQFLESSNIWSMAVEDRLEDLKTTNEIIAAIKEETAMISMNNVERRVYNELRKLDGLNLTDDERKIAEERIRDAVYNQIATEASAEAIRKQQEDMEKSWEETSKQIGQSLTDAIMEGGFSAKEYLEKLFRTMVLRPLLQPVMNMAQDTISKVIGGVLGSIGGGESGIGASGGMGWGLAIVALKDAYSIITNSFTGFGNTVQSAATSIGNYLATYGGAVGNAGTTISGAAQTLGALAKGLGGAMAWAGLWLAAGKYIQGDYSFNEGGDRGIGGFAGMKTGIKGPIGALITRAFGHGPMKLKAEDLIGTWDADEGAIDMGIQRRYKAKGGWFSSDKKKTTFDAILSEYDMVLDERIQGIVGSVTGFADALGMNTDKILTYSEKIRINIRGLKPEQINDAVEAMFVKWTENLVNYSFTDQINPYKIRVDDKDTKGTPIKREETTFEAMSRLASSLSAVNSTMKVLGLNLFEVSLAGADTAYQLIELAGGMEAFNSSTSAYYNAFYSESERMGKAFDQFSTSITDLGMEIPTSRQGFRDLVESLDLTTEAGRIQFTALMKLAPLADQLATYYEDQAVAAKKLIDEMAIDLAIRSVATSELEKYIPIWQFMIQSEQELADARAKGLDVTIMMAVQQRELNKMIQKMLEDLVNTLGDYITNIQSRVLRAYGKDAAADLFDILLQQRSEMSNATSLGMDTNALGMLQRKEYNNTLQGMLTDSLDNIKAAQAAVDSAMQEKYQAEIQGQIDIQRQIEDSARQAAEAWKRVAEELKRTIESLLGGKNSILSPEQKLAEAKRLWEQDLALARGGDVEAAGRLSQRANTYTEEARGYYASSTQYADIFNSVIGGLSEIQGSAAGKAAANQMTADQAAGIIVSLNEKISATSDNQLQVALDNLAQAQASHTQLLQADATAREQINLLDAALKGPDALVESINSMKFISGDAKKIVGDTLIQARATYDKEAATLIMLTEQYLLYQKGIDQAHTDAAAIIYAITGLDFNWIYSTLGAVNADLNSYDVGTPFVPNDQVANIHKGEIILDQASANILRNYGIKVSSSDSMDSEDIKIQNQILIQQNRILQEGFTQLITRQDEGNAELANQTKAIKLESRAA